MSDVRGAERGVSEQGAICQTLLLAGTFQCTNTAVAKVLMKCRGCQRQRVRYICSPHYERRAQMRCHSCGQFTLVYSEPVSV